MFKKKKFLIFFICIVFFNLTTALSHSAIEIKKISKEKFIELNNLLINKSYFDTRKNKLNKNFNLLYYAISRDGNYSSFSICDNYANNQRYDCVDYVEKFITLKSCERIAKQKCDILVANEKLILNKSKINLKNIKDQNFLIASLGKNNISIEKSNLFQSKPIVIYSKSFNFDLDE